MAEQRPGRGRGRVCAQGPLQVHDGALVLPLEGAVVGQHEGRLRAVPGRRVHAVGEGCQLRPPAEHEEAVAEGRGAAGVEGVVRVHRGEDVGGVCEAAQALQGQAGGEAVRRREGDACSQQSRAGGGGGKGPSPTGCCCCGCCCRRGRGGGRGRCGCAGVGPDGVEEGGEGGPATPEAAHDARQEQVRGPVGGGQRLQLRGRARGERELGPGWPEQRHGAGGRGEDRAGKAQAAGLAQGRAEAGGGGRIQLAALPERQQRGHHGAAGRVDWCASRARRGVWLGGCVRHERFGHDRALDGVSRGQAARHCGALPAQQARLRPDAQLNAGPNACHVTKTLVREGGRRHRLGCRWGGEQQSVWQQRQQTAVVGLRGNVDDARGVKPRS